jgi:hypothetical protein
MKRSELDYLSNRHSIIKIEFRIKLLQSILLGYPVFNLINFTSVSRCYLSTKSSKHEKPLPPQEYHSPTTFEGPTKKRISCHLTCRREIITSSYLAIPLRRSLTMNNSIANKNEERLSIILFHAFRIAFSLSICKKEVSETKDVKEIKKFRRGQIFDVSPGMSTFYHLPGYEAPP